MPSRVWLKKKIPFIRVWEISRSSSSVAIMCVRVLCYCAPPRISSQQEGMDNTPECVCVQLLSRRDQKWPELFELDYLIHFLLSSGTLKEIGPAESQSPFVKKKKRLWPICNMPPLSSWNTRLTRFYSSGRIQVSFVEIKAVLKTNLANVN